MIQCTPKNKSIPQKSCTFERKNWGISRCLRRGHRLGLGGGGRDGGLLPHAFTVTLVCSKSHRWSKSHGQEREETWGEKRKKREREGKTAAAVLPTLLEKNYFCWRPKWVFAGGQRHRQWVKASDNTVFSLAIANRQHQSIFSSCFCKLATSENEFS